MLKTFGSHAAIDLGLVPVGQAQSQAAAGATQTLTGRDVNPQEVDGIFDTLVRLMDAIETADLPELERLSGRLDIDLNRALFARSDLVPAARRWTAFKRDWRTSRSSSRPPSPTRSTPT